MALFQNWLLDQILKNHEIVNHNFKIFISDQKHYLIPESEWNAPEAKLKTEKGKQIITTNDYQFVVNQQTGEILVTDTKGKTLINYLGFSFNLKRSSTVYSGPDGFRMLSKRISSLTGMVWTGRLGNCFIRS